MFLLLLLLLCQSLRLLDEGSELMALSNWIRSGLLLLLVRREILIIIFLRCILLLVMLLSILIKGLLISFLAVKAVAQDRHLMLQRTGTTHASTAVLHL